LVASVNNSLFSGTVTKVSQTNIFTLIQP